MVFTLSSLLKPTLTIDSNASVTLLYETTDFDTIKGFEKDESLFLVDYDGRIASFIYHGNQIDTYLSQGFVYDGVSQSVGSPWDKPTVNDPYYNNQYAIPLTNIDDVWQITTGSTEVMVSIIDTGIDTDHPEFIGRISPLSYNSANEQVGIAFVEDDQGHGTMVAGVIAANINNGIGVAGVTANVELLIIKANDNQVETFKDSDIIRGIYYAVDNGADIINLSLGSTYANPLTASAITYAKEKNVLVIASSGNDGEEINMYPASFDDVISVGSVDSSKNLSSFSNYNNKVDIVAPGSSIYTTNLAASYTVASGTSFSAPFVTGIAALYKSIYPHATQPQLKQAIESTAKDLGTTGLDKYYGYGLVDALALISIDYLKITVAYPQDMTPIDYYIPSGQSVSIETPPTIENYEFMGYYLDATYQTPYLPSMTFTSNTTIYAYYRQTHVVITWVVGGDIILSERYAINDKLETPSTNKIGYLFHGWYLDQNYLEQIQDFSVTKDQTYYGYYETIYYELQFIADDHTTLLSIIQYSINDPITYIEAPLKPSDAYYHYRFIGWSEVTLFEQEMSVVYPIYQKTLKDELVGLKTSIDTIYENQAYTDTGAFVLVEGISIKVDGSIDPSKPGIQNIQYHFYDGETKVYTLKRIVHILADERLVVSLNQAITTLMVGEVYVEKGVTYNKGELIISGQVDTNIPGIYKITYTVTHLDQVVIKSRYVVILEAASSIPVAYLSDRKAYFYED